MRSGPPPAPGWGRRRHPRPARGRQASGGLSGPACGSWLGVPERLCGRARVGEDRVAAGRCGPPASLRTPEDLRGRRERGMRGREHRGLRRGPRLKEDPGSPSGFRCTRAGARAPAPRPGTTAQPFPPQPFGWERRAGGMRVEGRGRPGAGVQRAARQSLWGLLLGPGGAPCHSFASQRKEGGGEREKSTDTEAFRSRINRRAPGTCRPSRAAWQSPGAGASPWRVGRSISFPFPSPLVFWDRREPRARPRQVTAKHEHTGQTPTLGPGLGFTVTKTPRAGGRGGPPSRPLLTEAGDDTARPLSGAEGSLAQG